MTCEPLALMIYRAHRAGYSIEHLSTRFGIPAKRIALRLEAARRCLANGPNQSIEQTAGPPCGVFANAPEGPQAESRKRCARCGCAIDDGAFCTKCRAVFAELN